MTNIPWNHDGSQKVFVASNTWLFFAEEHFYTELTVWSYQCANYKGIVQDYIRQCSSDDDLSALHYIKGLLGYAWWEISSYD